MEKTGVVKLENNEFIGEIEGKTLNLSATGMRAVDLMLLSVAYCFAITVDAYVNHKGYKIEDLQVKVIGKKHPKENRYEKIRLEVSFKSDLPPDRIDRVMVIGKRGCTVSNTMLTPPEIEAVFVGDNKE
jgi:uncharacterized OsmC-like protein